MFDLIDRQVAIDVMCELMHHWFGGDPKDEIREIKRELGKLPSAEPKQTVSNFIESLPTSPLLVGKMPSAQAEIVRCKDCKFYREYGCQRAFVYPEPEDFCSRAERKTDGRD